METSNKSFSPKIEIQSHGIETARYNSMIHLFLNENEYAVYTCGNRLILLEIDT